MHNIYTRRNSVAIVAIINGKCNASIFDTRLIFNTNMNKRLSLYKYDYHLKSETYLYTFQNNVTHVMHPLYPHTSLPGIWIVVR